MLTSSVGCTSVNQTFTNVSAEQVWTAMKVVAESPAYDDWKVTANERWVDEPNRRIEVYRELAREFRRPGGSARTERRTMKFEVRLVETDPPTATYSGRGFAIPAHSRDDANRYFTEVFVILTGLPVTGD